MLDIERQYLKASFPIDSSPTGRVILGKEVQEQKAPSPITFKLSGSVMDLSLYAAPNASFPITFTEDGSEMETMLSHPQKHPEGMQPSPYGRSTDFSPEHCAKASLPRWMR